METHRHLQRRTRIQQDEENPGSAGEDQKAEKEGKMKTVTVYTAQEFNEKWPDAKFGDVTVYRVQIEGEDDEWQDGGYWRIGLRDCLMPNQIDSVIESLKQAKAYCEARP